MNSNEHVTEILASYALGCLEPDEHRLAARHLRTCAGCRAELQAYQAVVADLPLAAVQHAPAGDLKMRLMTRAAESRVNRHLREESLPERVRPALWAQLPRRVQTWGLVSLVLILALGLINLYLLARLNQPAPDSELMTVPCYPRRTTPARVVCWC